MNKLILAAMALAVGAAASAQSNITPEMLNKLAKNVQPQDQAIRNILATNDLRQLGTSPSSLKPFDDHFTLRVPSKGITNQASSGRCWLFTGMNVLRSKAINRNNLKELELSQTYLFFYDQLEKANLFLQCIIDTRKQPMDDRMVDWLFQNPLSDGGTFCGVADLVQKYGVVPIEVMPNNYQSEHTGQINSLLMLKLREMGLELRDLGNNTKTRQSDRAIDETILQPKKVEMLSEIYRILTLAYGIPTTEFTYTLRDAKDNVISTKTYTPQSFYKELWGQDDDLYDGYIMVMNDPLREYYKTYQIEYDRHTYDGHDWVYLNLPADEIKPMAIASLKDTTAMYFSCDVAKCLDRKRGYADLNNFDYGTVLGTTFNMDKRQRVMTHASGSSHAMTMVAVDIDTEASPVDDIISGAKKPVVRKWMVENSWGNTGYKGHLIMTDEWFDNYMFRLVVNKRYVAKKYIDLLKQKPTMLPAWDPMFMPEE